MDRHLSGVGAGDEVCGRPQVYELLLCEPLFPIHQLTMHHRDMGGRPPKGNAPKHKEVGYYLTKTSLFAHQTPSPISLCQFFTCLRVGWVDRTMVTNCQLTVKQNGDHYCKQCRR